MNLKSLRKYIENFHKSNVIKLITVVVFTIFPFSVNSSSLSKNYIKYIDNYKDIAILHQQKYGIPASITLAQGLLESGAGRSTLAREAKNHFGIKCHRGWKGRGFYMDDDAKDECFRVYESVENSYEDHARFLKKKRYERLFHLKVTDYKGWAKGLSRCGYATDPAYPQKLIRIIEDYKLYEYDEGQKKRADRKHLEGDEEMEHSIEEVIVAEIMQAHKMKQKNGLYYVKARNGDTFKLIGEEFGISDKKLAKYNDYKDKRADLYEGNIVYLQEKHKEFTGEESVYVVKEGDNLHTISQKFGLRLKELKKRNKIKDPYNLLRAGDIIDLK